MFVLELLEPSFAESIYLLIQSVVVFLLAYIVYKLRGEVAIDGIDTPIHLPHVVMYTFQCILLGILLIAMGWWLSMLVVACSNMFLWSIAMLPKSKESL